MVALPAKQPKRPYFATRPSNRADPVFDAVDNLPARASTRHRPYVGHRNPIFRRCHDARDRCMKPVGAIPRGRPTSQTTNMPIFRSAARYTAPIRFLTPLTIYLHGASTRHRPYVGHRNPIFRRCHDARDRCMKPVGAIPRGRPCNTSTSERSNQQNRSNPSSKSFPDVLGDFLNFLWNPRLLP